MHELPSGSTQLGLGSGVTHFGHDSTALEGIFRGDQVAKLGEGRVVLRLLIGGVLVVVGVSEVDGGVVMMTSDRREGGGGVVGLRVVVPGVVEEEEDRQREQQRE